MDTLPPAGRCRFAVAWGRAVRKHDRDVACLGPCRWRWAEHSCVKAAQTPYRVAGPAETAFVALMFFFLGGHFRVQLPPLGQLLVSGASALVNNNNGSPLCRSRAGPRKEEGLFCCRDAHAMDEFVHGRGQASWARLRVKQLFDPSICSAKPSQDQRKEHLEATQGGGHAWIWKFGYVIVAPKGAGLQKAVKDNHATKGELQTRENAPHNDVSITSRCSARNCNAQLRRRQSAALYADARNRRARLRCKRANAIARCSPHHTAEQITHCSNVLVTVAKMLLQSLSTPCAGSRVSIHHARRVDSCSRLFDLFNVGLVALRGVIFLARCVCSSSLLFSALCRFSFSTFTLLS